MACITGRGIKSINNSVFEASSFLKLYNEMNNKFFGIINKEINIAKRKTPNRLENLIKIKKSLGKTSKEEIFKIQKKINWITEIIKSEMDVPIQFFLSGSIIKGTYVHGLSDIDILIFLNKKDLSNAKPKIIQNRILNILKKYFSKQNMKKDKEAVNVFINKNHVKVQIVPAVFKNEKIFFPTIGGERWKRINPDIFSNLLKEQDKKLKRKLTLSIRIAKIIMSNFSKNYCLTSHHLEVLSYLSSKNSKNKSILDLLSNIFSYSSNRIMGPVKDSSRQVKSIDEYLGPKGNLKRKRISNKLKEISEKINKEEINI